MLFEEISACRVCGSKELIEILSLGEQYVVDFVDNPSGDSNKGPLNLVICKNCGLLQLKHTFDHDSLYKKYWYKSGISTTMVAALSDIVKKAETLIPLAENDIVIDIGSNDGTLLEQYNKNNITRIGFEPSNLGTLVNAKNITVIHDYFTFEQFNKEFMTKKAKIITSIAMFYDLDNPNKFVEDVKNSLDDNGLWIIQMNYLGSMLSNNTFDNISHEHLEYYSFTTLNYLLRKHDLVPFDVETNDVNGGSFRIYIKKVGAKIKPFAGSSERIEKLVLYEKNLELDKIKTYNAFADRIKKIRTDLLNLLNEKKKEGKKIFIYGASTRGIVILQYVGITNKLIDAATDKNPDKWGKYIVDTEIKIMSIDQYRQEKPDYLFVLPYHFIDEIKEQEHEFINKGGKLIVAIPNVRVIE
jgi:hypothetical protein